MRIRECFEAADWGYIIQAGVLNPLSDTRFPETGVAVFKVDTGFNGPLMVTGDIFEFLQLRNIEVPDDIRPTYGTMGGPLTLRSAPAVLEVDRKQLETDILTPITGSGRMLVGYQVLKQLNLALLEKKACFIRT